MTYNLASTPLKILYMVTLSGNCKFKFCQYIYCGCGFIPETCCKQHVCYFKCTCICLWKCHLLLQQNKRCMSNKTVTWLVHTPYYSHVSLQLQSKLSSKLLTKNHFCVGYQGSWNWYLKRVCIHHILWSWFR